MTPTKSLIGAAAVLGLVFSITASKPRAQAPAAGPQAPVPQAPAAPVPGGAPAGAPAPGGAQAGRGGGRGANPAAPLFADNCAGCHGTDLAGGRAPSLFDQKWLATVDDARIINSIKNGVPNTEMEGFGKQLTDEQIWQLLTYIRTQTGAMTPRPAYNDTPDGLVITSEKQTFKVEVLTKDLFTPWGIAFLPDGRLLITERKGTIRILDKNNVLSEPVKNTPKPHVQQDGGYLDIEVHPQYAQNGWIYLSYSEDQPGYVAPPPAPPAAAPAPPVAAPAPAAGAPAGAAGAGGQAPAGAAGGGGRGGGRGGPPQAPSMTVWIRGKINANNEWTDQQTVARFPAALYTTAGAHYGSRFIFDTQGHLFFTIGERGQMTNAQDLTIPLGKIHRVNDDGTIPRDNPFVNTAGAIPSIWSYGHRNPEGLAWEPGTGALWESEHGPTNGDEVNIIVKGHNYGWGVASKGSQGGITKTSEPGMDDPIVYYTPTLAPAGMTFYTGNRYPNWRNTSLFLSGLAGQRLMRLEVANGKVTKQEAVFNTLGRVRDIVVGPDGLFYIALQSPSQPLSADTAGKVVRLIPQ